MALTGAEGKRRVSRDHYELWKVLQQKQATTLVTNLTLTGVWFYGDWHTLSLNPQDQ